MKPITVSLAQAQIKQNRKRTIITVVGIALSTAMITAVFGFAASGIEAMRNLVGDGHIQSYSAVLYSLASVLGSIIILSSVVVISNAFRISAAERMRQFGILKSTGATKRQILKIVLHEGLYLSAISIPIGLGAGLLIQWLGSSIGDALLAPMNKLIQDGLTLRLQFVFSWPSVLLALGLSFFTVMLSAWFPARKAAKIPAIDAIRLTQEIKATGKKLRTAWLTQRIFGFEGALAAKAIKRSRRSYRAMVAALTISVVLFLVCGSLNQQMMMALNQTYANIDASSVTTYNIGRYGKGGDPLDSAAVRALTNELAAYPDTQLYGIAMDPFHTARIHELAMSAAMRKYLEPVGEFAGVALLTPDPAHYEALCRKAGVPIGSNILINSMRLVIDGRQTEFQPLDYTGQTLLLSKDGKKTRLPLHAQLTGTQVPQELLFAADDAEMLIVVVPDADAYQCVWFGNSLDTAGFTAYAEAVLLDFRQTSAVPDDLETFYVTDVTAITDMTRGLTKLITIFLYGFVAMLSLIGLTSVIAAIAANVRLRAREFAVLRSVGMTEGGVRRMLALESVMSASKALLYGLPLGTLAMYLVHLAVTINDSFAFVFPWLTAVQAVSAVVLIAVIATQYAAGKLRRGSIMDAIRMNEGV